MMIKATVYCHPYTNLLNFYHNPMSITLILAMKKPKLRLINLFKVIQQVDVRDDV